MLLEENLFGIHDKVETAIERLRAFEPPEGYFVAFSGGKDSQCIYHLCVEAGVRFDAHYSHTTVDPPEVIYFMREHYPEVIVDKPDITMWQLIVKKGMPPTRKVRYCCDVLKEGGGRGRIAVTGVRWEESTKRKHNRGLLELNNYTRQYIKLMNDNDEARRMFETCTMKSMHTLNPIIDSIPAAFPTVVSMMRDLTALAVSDARWLGLFRCKRNLPGIPSTSRHISGHLKRCSRYGKETASHTISGARRKM